MGGTYGYRAGANDLWKGCQPCGFGTFQEEEGTTACVKCQPGRHTANHESTAASHCVAIPFWKIVHCESEYDCTETVKWWIWVGCAAAVIAAVSACVLLRSRLQQGKASHVGLADGPE